MTHREVGMAEFYTEIGQYNCAPKYVMTETTFVIFESILRHEIGRIERDGRYLLPVEDYDDD